MMGYVHTGMHLLTQGNGEMGREMDMGYILPRSKNLMRVSGSMICVVGRESGNQP